MVRGLARQLALPCGRLAAPWKRVKPWHTTVIDNVIRIIVLQQPAVRPLRVPPALLAVAMCLTAPQTQRGESTTVTNHTYSVRLPSFGQWSKAVTRDPLSKACSKPGARWQCSGQPAMLTREQAATHCGFLVSTFDAWVRNKLLPPSDSISKQWNGSELSAALERLTTEGCEIECHPSRKNDYFPLPFVQRVPRTSSDIKRWHHYRRGVPGALPGKPRSPIFMAALIDKERRLARECGEMPSQTSETFEANTLPSPPVQQKHNRPKRHSGTLADADHLPLYPDENQIGLAILGPQRAHEWKAKAVLLEREGLPLIDPVMGGRSWRAVREFFATRDGIEPARIPSSVSTSRRVRCVPFAQDGTELSHAQEETTDTVGRNTNLTRRSRVRNPGARQSP